MTVNRTTEQAGPATLSIHFATPFEPAPAPPFLGLGTPVAERPTTAAATSTTTLPLSSTETTTPTGDHVPVDRIVTIDMKHKTDEHILEAFMAATQGVTVQATDEEVNMLRMEEESKSKSAVDRERSKQASLAKKRDEDLLKAAQALAAS